MSIPLFKPTIKRKDMDSVLTCLVSDQIGMSSLIDDMLQLVSHELNADGGAALRELPRALELTADFLALEKGDSVILSPLAPRLYGDFFKNRGIKTLYADVNELNGTMDFSCVKKLMDFDPKAVFAIHPMGFLEPTRELSQLGVPLIEDISQSLGAFRGDIKAGSLGDLVLMSMEPQHIITSGGGTLLLTRTEEGTNTLNELVQNLSHQSILPDMNGSLGLVQWSQLPAFIEKRQQLADMFSRSAVRGRHRTFKEIDEESPVWYAFPLNLKDSMKEIRQYVRKKGIDTTLAFSSTCIDLIEDKSLCPVASRLAMGTLLFPLYPMMGQKNAELISRVLTTLP